MLHALQRRYATHLIQARYDVAYVHDRLAVVVDLVEQVIPACDAQGLELVRVKTPDLWMPQGVGGVVSGKMS